MIQKILFILIFIWTLYPINAFEVDKHKITLEKIEDYLFCHQNKYPAAYCQDALIRWVDKNPTDTIKAARMTRKNMISWGAIDLFHLGRKSPEFSCEDEQLILALKSAFSLPISNKSVIEKALVLTFDSCGKMGLPAKLETGLSVKQDNFSTVCPRFKSSGLLKGVKKLKCK